MLATGKAHILDVLLEATAVQNYYLALITATNVQTSYDAAPTTLQIGAGLTEVTGTGYARITLTRATDWTRSAGVATASAKTFTVGAGGWTSVNGYAICLSDVEGTGDAIFAESLPTGQQGNKNAADTVVITPKITGYDARDL
jgi:hypothetical protein